MPSPYTDILLRSTIGSYLYLTKDYYKEPGYWIGFDVAWYNNHSIGYIIKSKSFKACCAKLFARQYYMYRKSNIGLDVYNFGIDLGTIRYIYFDNY